MWRAIVFAVPAGLVIWLISNITVCDVSLAERFIQSIDPITVVFGLNGVIFLAYIIAIPANEIVIPTILMLTVMSARVAGASSGAGVMFELDDVQTATILQHGGWTMLTGINIMLYSLLHNPCSTTICTIYKETGRLSGPWFQPFYTLSWGWYSHL